MYFQEPLENTAQIPSAVSQLAEPSQILVDAVLNLINYQDEADLATRALPELIKLLNDEEQDVITQAAMVVNQLCKRPASRHALSNSTSLIKALLQALERSDDLETSKFTSETLQNLSQNQQGLLTIFKTGGIRALIIALGSPIEAVVCNALTTLHNLLLHQEGAKMTVRLNGGLQKLVNLLQRDNHKFLAVVTDCLHLLAYGSQEGKLIILATNGPAQLVRILNSYSYEKLLFTTTRVIKVLSVCQSNKPALVQAGAMQALALCLNHQSERLIQESLWAIRNLSDAATKEMNLEPLMQRLLQLLDGSDINMITCAAGTISNLTCNNPNNKSFACKVGAVQMLIQTIRNASDRDEIVEPAICALRHLTNCQPDAEIAQDAVRIHGGLPDISRLLDAQSNWPIVTATAGLIRNLAYNQQNMIALRELDTVRRLTLLLGRVYQALQDSPEDLAGIKMERVTVNIIGALQVMAIDYQCRLAISGANIIGTLVSLLYNDNETIVVATLDLAAELAREPEIASSIESQGGLTILMSLLNSASESIRQRAGLLFSLVSGDKTPEYTQRLSNEINTLFQGDNVNNVGTHWIESSNQDLPAVYSVEGHIQAAPMLHSGTNRRNIYSTGSSTYVTQHDIEVSGYGRTGQVNRSEDSSRVNLQQQSQQPIEPWFDTDL